MGIVLTTKIFLDELDEPLAVNEVRWGQSKKVEDGLEMSATEPSHLECVFYGQPELAKFFYQWAGTVNGRKSGSVQYINSDGSVHSILTFTDALCAGIHLRFTKHSDIPFHHIAWINFSNTDFAYQGGAPQEEESVATSRAEEVTVGPTATTEQEGNIESIEFFNENGATLDKPKKGDTVLLRIVSQGLAGETIDIDLSGHRIIYEHDGEELTNGQLTSVRVIGDQTDVPLRVIKLKRS